MMIFWWSGRGYFAALILLLTLTAFGVILRVGADFIPDSPWYWSLAFPIAAAINWRVGCRLNRKKRATLPGFRLWYRARHTFFSLPMETLSIVMVLAGIGLLIAAFV